MLLAGGPTYHGNRPVMA